MRSRSTKAEYRMFTPSRGGSEWADNRRTSRRVYPREIFVSSAVNQKNFFDLLRLMLHDVVFSAAQVAAWFFHELRISAARREHSVFLQSFAELWGSVDKYVNILFFFETLSALWHWRTKLSIRTREVMPLDSSRNVTREHATLFEDDWVFRLSSTRFYAFEIMKRTMECAHEIHPVIHAVRPDQRCVRFTCVR